jgi:hypothetical protein
VKQADIIKVAAVVTATPRWVGALLAAEGIGVPGEWLTWWVPVSALFGAAMAFVEGWAFAFVFAAWRNQQRERAARRLLWLAVLSAAIFVVVLAPFIAAQVRNAPLEQVLGSGVGLWIWAAAVAASTITIVASVGYAQKAPRVSQERQAAPQKRTVSEPEPQEFHLAACTVAGCGWRRDDYPTATSARNGLNAHQRKHVGVSVGDNGAEA